MSRQPLFRKYVAVFVILVCGTLLISGLLQTAFSYEQNQNALVAVQHEKATAAAARIQEFINDVERHVGAAVPAPFIAAGPVTPEQRRDDLLRLLRLVPAVTDVSYLDAQGHEQVRISRVSTNALRSGLDRSGDLPFLSAKDGRTHFGEVYFRNQSEPYLSLGVPESAPGQGVTVAEVNLKLIWDLVSRIQVGTAGYAYVVDAHGQLIAHTDLSLVLQRADFSGLPQVQAARIGSVLPQQSPTIARDLAGHQVLSASAEIDRPGWSMFVEQPLEEAFAPLYALLARMALVLAGGVVLSVLASLFLARRMTQPIRKLQMSAARIGSGALDERIDVRTGDELEELGEAFNRMTSQLGDSYATLERKVEERTHDLAEAVERLRGLGQVSEAVSSSVDLLEVLTTVVEHAVQLSGAEAGAIYEYDESSAEFRLRATHGLSQDLITAIGEAGVPLDETVIGQAALRREAIQVPDTVDVHAGPVRSLAERGGFRALLAVPLLREDRIIGGLIIWRTLPGAFGQDTIDLLQTFARQSVLAIQNARLFREIERKGQQIEIVSRHKSEFLANMSHELRTPLNAINGFSQVLIEKQFGELNVQQEAYLQDILNSGRHLLSLINDILDLSKVEAGRMDVQLGSFSLLEALENGLTMVRERAGRCDIALSLEVDPAIDLLEADERKIKQVVFNLLANAVKFTPDHGRVDVVARHVRDEVHIAVRDTGVGIALADQARIFDEFSQVGAHDVNTTEGTGLGLTLARRFVELHGGLLWVTSQPGVGSTFTFSLPLRNAA